MWQLLAFLVSAQTQAETPGLPAWMAGCWEHRSGDRWTEECWTAPRAGTMMGSSRSGTGEKLREWEMMRIALDQQVGDGRAAKMVFFAHPSGQQPTVFAWSPSNEPGLSFYNAAHDYPQRVRYWRDGKYLMAEIALKDGSKARRWRYVPMRMRD